MNKNVIVSPNNVDNLKFSATYRRRKIDSVSPITVQPQIQRRNLPVFRKPNLHESTQEPCYRREDRAMPLYISIRIEF